MTTDITWADVKAAHTVHEDATTIVLDKPAGLSVTGERHDTDIVRLAADEGVTLYPAHRIDKVTSGLILFATDLAAHGALTRQFNKRTVAKTYLAVTAGTGLPESGTIELPLSVGRKNRVRVAAPRESIAEHGGIWGVPDADVFTHVKTYPSTTAFRRLWQDGTHTVLALIPETGRRHQIRVHLAWIGQPIIGDPLFDRVPKDEVATGRTALHSWRLSFDHDGRRLDLEAFPGADFWAPTGLADPGSIIA
ncbi:RluA family pseudouridine synthase [Actinorhabdospora filicis]|uniref:RluA family pseudouridine synthase n=1 Tax=Actinorhabdospora filicis TaxID=1785913 RepID=UPI0025559130|nr:RNA pseudouridine synthase [Actinorhabdospora filicis]